MWEWVNKSKVYVFLVAVNWIPDLPVNHRQFCPEIRWDIRPRWWLHYARWEAWKWRPRQGRQPVYAHHRWRQSARRVYSWWGGRAHHPIWASGRIESAHFHAWMRNISILRILIRTTILLTINFIEQEIDWKISTICWLSIDGYNEDLTDFPYQSLFTPPALVRSLGRWSVSNRAKKSLLKMFEKTFQTVSQFYVHWGLLTEHECRRIFMFWFTLEWAEMAKLNDIVG